MLLINTLFVQGMPTILHGHLTRAAGGLLFWDWCWAHPVSVPVGPQKCGGACCFQMTCAGSLLRRSWNSCFMSLCQAAHDTCAQYTLCRKNYAMHYPTRLLRLQP